MITRNKSALGLWKHSIILRYSRDRYKSIDRSLVLLEYLLKNGPDHYRSIGTDNVVNSRLFLLRCVVV